jgi:hypothetical protein
MNESFSQTHLQLSFSQTQHICNWAFLKHTTFAIELFSNTTHLQLSFSQTHLQLSFSFSSFAHLWVPSRPIISQPIVAHYSLWISNLYDYSWFLFSSKQMWLKNLPMTNTKFHTSSSWALYYCLSLSLTQFSYATKSLLPIILHTSTYLVSI